MKYDFLLLWGIFRKFPVQAKCSFFPYVCCVHARGGRESFLFFQGQLHCAWFCLDSLKSCLDGGSVVFENFSFFLTWRCLWWEWFWMLFMLAWRVSDFRLKGNFWVFQRKQMSCNGLMCLPLNYTLSNWLVSAQSWNCRDGMTLNAT